MIENAIVLGNSVDFSSNLLQYICTIVDNLQTDELVKEACLRMKEVKWCEEISFASNNVRRIL